MLLENEGHFCLPVIEYPHPVQRAFTLDQRSVVTKREPRFELARTRDLEGCYLRRGVILLGTERSLDVRPRGSTLSVREGYPSRGPEGGRHAIRPTTGRFAERLLYRATELGGRQCQAPKDSQRQRPQAGQKLMDFIPYGRREISDQDIQGRGGRPAVRATSPEGEAVPTFESSMARRVGSEFRGSDKQRHIGTPRHVPRPRARPRGLPVDLAGLVRRVGELRALLRGGRRLRGRRPGDRQDVHHRADRKN